MDANLGRWLSVGLLAALPCLVTGAEGPAKVALEPAGSGWLLRVNGSPFTIHGVGGGGPALLEKLKLAGGNCVRGWGINEMAAKDEKGVRFIDRAHQLGLMVVPGLWIGHERHGFNYGDAAMVAKQRAEVLAAVRAYKDHPAVLMWGLGNEMEGITSATGSVAVFSEIEELAKLIKKEDPHHPVMSIIAYNPGKVPNIKRLCPSLDVLGINSYGGAAGAGEQLKAAGWTKPFAVTEFGVSGFWEVGKTPWGAPIEPTSKEKAAKYYATNRLVMEVNDGKELCLGTFAFLWGFKQECTPTWFGMFLSTHEKLPQVDALTYTWTGAWPANRCPAVTGITSPLSGGTAAKPGQQATAAVECSDPEDDALTYRWELMAEQGNVSSGGDREAAPATFPNLIVSGKSRACVFTAPAKPGAYRLFVYVYDGKGGAGTANMPFLVAP